MPVPSDAEGAADKIVIYFVAHGWYFPPQARAEIIKIIDDAVDNAVDRADEAYSYYSRESR